MANEKRLIDADAFLKDILTAGIGKTIIEYSESDIGYMIRKRPTVDAVEVIRCKDCIGQSTWFKDAETGCEICGMSGMYPKGEFDFCSYGDRRKHDHHRNRTHRAGRPGD